MCFSTCWTSFLESHRTFKDLTAMECHPHNLLSVNVPWHGLEDTGSYKARLAKISRHLYPNGQKVRLAPWPVLNVQAAESGESYQI